MSRDGTWDRLLTHLQVEADAAGELDWQVSVDSIVVRVHKHGPEVNGEADVAHGGRRRRTRSRASARTNRHSWRRPVPRADHQHVRADLRAGPAARRGLHRRASRGLPDPAGAAVAAAGAAAQARAATDHPGCAAWRQGQLRPSSPRALAGAGVITVTRSRPIRSATVTTAPRAVAARRLRRRPLPRPQHRRASTRSETWRGLTTRYDKHVLTYRRGVVLAAILCWLNVLETGPRGLRSCEAAACHSDSGASCPPTPRAWGRRSAPHLTTSFRCRRLTPRRSPGGS